MVVKVSAFIMEHSVAFLYQDHAGSAEGNKVPSFSKRMVKVAADISREHAQQNINATRKFSHHSNQIQERENGRRALGSLGQL